MQLRPGGAARGEPQAGDGARGGDGDRPGGDGARASSSPVEDGPVVIVLPGPPRELQRDVAARRWTASRSRAVLERAEPLRGPRRCGCSACPSRRSPSPCARSRPRARPLAARDHDLPAPRRARDRRPPPPGRRRGARRRSIARPGRAPRALPLQPRRRDDRRAGRGPAATAAGSRSAESCTGGLLAARLTEPPGRLGVRAGRRRRLLERGQGRAARASPPELIESHGAVSPEVAEAMADGALERFERRRRRSGSPASPAPTAAARRSRSATSASASRPRAATKLARDPVIPGDRDDIRDRACTLALHLMRRLLRGEDFPL